jgi:Tfp pilus assembly protein PilX
MNPQKLCKRSERGVALIVTLLAILVLSVLAVGIMSTSQSQTWTSMNYRLAAQSRYVAETGLQTTMNWLSSSSYPIPTFASYTMTTNPVQYSGKAVVLSAVSGVSSNYPDSTVVTNFQKVATGTVPGVPNASYATYATLLRMQSGGGVAWLTGTGSGAMQTWQITSIATINGVANSTVQVSQIFERTGNPIFQYGLEALGTGCGAITLAGNDSTDSYNSALGTYSSQTPGSAGSIATNGNVNLASTAKVNGNIAAPNTKVGSCPDGLTDSGSKNYGTLTAVSKMSAPLPFGCSAQPCYPKSPAPITTSQNISTGCTGVTGCTKNASDTIYDGGSKTTANDFTLAPGSYGNITINGADVVHFTAGTYTVNSVNFAQDGQFVVDSGPVVLQLTGNCSSGCPTESGLPSGYSSTEVIYGAGYAGMNGCAPSGGKGVIANPNVYGSTTCGPSQTTYSGIPSNLQIVYGGTYTIRLGGMPNAAVIYSPAGSYYTPGAPVGLYGSVITDNFNDSSGSPWHYDTAEANSVMQIGNFRPVGGFSWSKF